VTWCARVDVGDGCASRLCGGGPSAYCDDVTIPRGNGSTEATEDESSKSKGEQLALLGLVVTVAPIVFGGIRIMSVSGGNVDTLRALVQNLDVVALGLGTILPFAASILLWFVILTFGTAASPRRTKDERNRAVATILVWRLSSSR